MTQTLKSLKRLAAASACLLLTACTSGEKVSGFGDEAAPPSPQVVPADAKPGEFPSFTEPDYTYVYRVSCYCPDWGLVEVKVRDGEVADAKLLQDAPNGSAGPAQVPEHLSKTLDELIQAANETGGTVEFKWPEGQAYPEYLTIDHLPTAVDDEISYFIFSVDVE